MKRIIKNNLKVIIAFIIGIVLSGSIVYAINVASSSVSYSRNGSTVLNVEGALNELYTRANTWINPNNNFGTPQYYAFGTYKGLCSSTDTSCNSYSDFPTASINENPPTGKNVYAAKYADGGYGVCIKRNGTEHCFRARNYIAEAQHIKKVFSEANDSCNIVSDTVSCGASDFNCGVDSYGSVSCHDGVANTTCSVFTNGRMLC